MAQVLITDTKLDTLAEGIAVKSGATLPLTLDQMITEVSGITTAGAADTWSWMGKNPYHIGQIYSGDFTLANTTFSSWTASTTSARMIASAVATTANVQMDLYDYYIRWQYDCNYAYVAGAPETKKLLRTFAANWQEAHRRPYGIDNFISMSDYYNYALTALSANVYQIYKNASGVMTWTTTTAYGVIPALTAAAFDKTTGTSSINTTLTIKTPSIYVRCTTAGAAYFNTTAPQYIDTTGTTIKIRGDLYRVDKDSSDLKAMYLEAIQLYSNPL